MDRGLFCALLWLCLLVAARCSEEPPEGLAALVEGAEGLQAVGGGGGGGGELGCRRRLYRTSVQRQDSEGRRCSGVVTLAACSGRCDSHEISEWRFPWKRSRHPVCGFSARVLALAVLDTCDEGAAPSARLLPVARPSACRCRACKASTTSCGWLPAHTPALDPYTRT